MSRRVLVAQDISCVGQCSMAVALPILACHGLEVCPLPTAVLSTHTGGFGAPAVVHLDADLPAFVRHWHSQGITFDAVLAGYLGSQAAVEAVEMAVEHCLAPGGVLIVDPAMADHGRLYSGLDEAYAEAMGRLCRRADVVLPNLTEAALLTGRPWSREPSVEVCNELLAALERPLAVLTGVDLGPEETGVLLRQNGVTRHYSHSRLPGRFFGTGDIFAACFTGRLLTGADSFQAAKAAADFTLAVIRATLERPGEGYGVAVQRVLGTLFQSG